MMMISLIESLASDHQGGSKWDGISEVVNGHLEVCMREREREREREKERKKGGYRKNSNYSAKKIIQNRAWRSD